ncbi:MAG: tetratricopeptide repeat protein [Acidobacteria bacterium]|nr:tetratricopeptide repeat protein [Acidobacteriota bacterium]
MRFADLTLTKGAVWLLALFLLNSSYLFSFSDPTILYVINILIHVGVGWLMVGVCLLLWRKLCSSVARRIACLLFLAGGALGVWLTFAGAVRANMVWVNVHIGLSAAGAVIWLASVLLRRRSALRGNDEFCEPTVVMTRLSHRPAPALVVLAALLPAAAGSYQYFFPNPAETITNELRTPLSMEEEAGKGGPFFPSSSNTTVGKIIPANFFMHSDSCAGSGCHPDIFQQWNSSAHHFSSFNNQWYRKSIEYMQDVVGTSPSKWCAGCHDHAVFFNGRFEKPIKEQIDTPEAQAGLACTSCHSIVQVNDTMGNGGFVIEYPPLHDLAVSKNPFIKGLHDFVVRVNPKPHRKTFLKPFVRGNTAEFCSSCHKVHLDIPVNNYRWFRGFNDYDNWQASGVSGQGARSFYYPKESKKCVGCHMPEVDSQDAGNIGGKIHSHRFPGANTALPTANQDAEQLKAVQDFLTAKQVTVDIFGITHEGGQVQRAETPARRRSAEEAPLSSTFAVGEEAMVSVASTGSLTDPAKLVAPLAAEGTPVRAGEALTVHVVVRTRNVGHFFPGGTVDAFDVWTELKGEDEKGNVFYWSGLTQDEPGSGRKGPVEPGAHFYKSLQLDEHGNLINKRNAWSTRSVLYVRLIPPGAADTVHFRMKVPKNARGKIRLTAKVNYRKFAWWNTQWAYAGVRDPNQPNFSLTAAHDDGRWIFAGDTSKVSGKLKEIPDLPIVMMAQDTRSVLVVEKLDRESEARMQDRERWNDFGIGLLLQGDLKGAEWVFQQVTQIEPQYADGWVNVARVRVQEGNPEGAQEYLAKALQLAPELPKAHFFYGLTLKAQGKYDQALDHFRKALALFPRDRVVRNQAGRILFLKRDFRKAIEEFKQTLAIDMEDLQAHYNLMLCYQGLGDEANALREQKLYQRFKADEASQFITGNYRRLNEHDNNERQSIHVHDNALEYIDKKSPASGSYKQAVQATADSQSRRADAAKAARPRVSLLQGAGSSGY